MFKERKKRNHTSRLIRFGFIREKDIKRVISLVFGIIQPCMVFGALCLISFVVYIWFTHLKCLNKAAFTDFEYLVRTLLGIWLLFNILLNYLSAVFVNAGTSRELFPNINVNMSKSSLQIEILSNDACSKWDKSKEEHIAKNEQIMKDYFFNENKLEEVRGLRNNPYIWRYCDECNLPKPPRSHHCSICQECVLNMDHHCPWVASCVGLANYRYFVLFMLWVSIGALYFIINAFPYAGFNFFFIKSIYSRASFRGDPDLRRSQSRVMLGCIFCLAVMFAVSCLLLFHIFLCLKGLSTIELFSNTKLRSYFKRKGLSWRAPSDHGLKKNWQYVFRTYGRFWWITWCLPMLPQRQLLLKEVMGETSTAN